MGAECIWYWKQPLFVDEYFPAYSNVADINVLTEHKSFETKKTLPKQYSMRKSFHNSYNMKMLNPFIVDEVVLFHIG